jgi:hypothetical protein
VTKQPGKRPPTTLLSIEEWCRVYTLLNLPWLPVSVQHALRKALGLSSREAQRNAARSEALGLWWLLQDYKYVMRVRGDRPRGGIHPTALEWVASDTGTTVANVKQKLRRYLPDAEERAALLRLHAELAPVALRFTDNKERQGPG